MTTEALTLPVRSARQRSSRLWQGNTGPVLVVVLAIVALWYVGRDC